MYMLRLVKTHNKEPCDLGVYTQCSKCFVTPLDYSGASIRLSLCLLGPNGPVVDMPNGDNEEDVIYDDGLSTERDVIVSAQ